MNALEQRLGEFAAWLQDREADYARRLRFTRSERRVLLKTEAAELSVIRARFDRLLGVSALSQGEGHTEPAP